MRFDIRKIAGVPILAAAFLLPSMALAGGPVPNLAHAYAGADAGDWGGKKGAVIGLPDDVCANMGAVGKVNLASNFGFDIPLDAEITGIEAWIKSSSHSAQDVQVQLATDATIDPPTEIGVSQILVSPGEGGNCASTTESSVNGSLANWGVGGIPDSIDPEDVNNPAFGLIFTKIVKSEIKVDAICLEIAYDTDEGPAVDTGCFDPPPVNTITLQKVVDNTGGGAAAATAWTLTATGPETISGVTGDPAITAAEVQPGDYTLTESDVADYIPDTPALNCIGASLLGNVLTLNEGESAVCTFFNEFVPPPGTLTLVKEVDNTGGGGATHDEWTLTATGPDTISGASGSSAVTGVQVAAGDYVLTESALAGYTSDSPPLDCVGGSLSGNTLTLGLRESAVCTFYNRYIPPPPPVEDIPTLSEWALILLGMMMLGMVWFFGTGVSRKR